MSLSLFKRSMSTRSRIVRVIASSVRGRIYSFVLRSSITAAALRQYGRRYPMGIAHRYHSVDSALVLPARSP